jgi:hypothetical protein
MSAGALLLLVLVLVAVDERVRNQFAKSFSDARPSAEFADAGSRLLDLVTVVAEAARQQTVEHAVLMLFVLAGTALVLFMIRA